MESQNAIGVQGNEVSGHDSVSTPFSGAGFLQGARSADSSESSISVAFISKKSHLIRNRTLSVFYPDESYYKWFENNVFNDHSMTCVTMSFPLIQGWIDSEYDEPPQYAKDALN